MEIRKNMTVTLKDYFYFNVRLIRKTLITYAIVLVAAVILFNGIMNGFNFNLLKFWLDTLLFYGIAVLVMLGYFLLMVYFASKKAYIPNKKYYENIEITINEEGIFQKCEGAESSIQKEKIFQIKDTKSALLIMLNPRQGMLLPKKDLTKEEVEEIKKILSK